MLTIEIKKIPYASTWEIRQQVMWPDKPMDYVKLPNDPQGYHYGLFVRHNMLSIISVFVTGRKAQFRKFATIAEEQGKGYGSKLLSFVMDTFSRKDIQTIWCNARTDKIAFYKRFGLMPTEMTFSKGGVDYVIMTKNI